MTINKPFQAEEILLAIKRPKSESSFAGKLGAQKQGWAMSIGDRIIAKSEAMRKIIATASRIPHIGRPS